MKYKVIANSSLETFEQEVNNHIKQGWELLGGVSVSISESDEYCYMLYAQAMTKKK